LYKVHDLSALYENATHPLVASHASRQSAGESLVKQPSPHPLISFIALSIFVVAIGHSIVFTGDCVGFDVGSMVGLNVGDGVGLFVGSLVGSFVGSAVGSFVGLVVGSPVGAFVGSFDGLFVGASDAHSITISTSPVTSPEALITK